MRRVLPLALLLLTLSVFSFPTIFSGIVPPANAVSASFSFAASGDMGSLSVGSSVNSLNRLVTESPSFFLGLVELSYDQTVTGNTWCGQFKSSFNGIQILPGDHDTGGHNSATFGETHSYERYVNACPLTLGVPLVCGPVSGACYGKEYYFDYPATNPFARFIFASPKIYNMTGVCTSSPNCSSQTGQPCTDQYGCWPYGSGDVHYNWVSNSIDNARATGIKWVIVATHKLCISASDATCSMGIGFFNMLVQKKADLIIQAHDNAYERSKQIALNSAAGCASIKTDSNGYTLYNSGCVVDDGTQGYYTPGAGSVVVVQGAWANDLYSVNNTSSNGGANAAEAPYFVKLMGGNTPGNGLGFTKYTVSSSRIDVQTTFQGTYSDTLSLWGGSTPLTSASWSPLSRQVGQTVTFTGSASGGVPPYAFTWDFGDGAQATGTTVSHAYGSANYYNVTLTAVDSANNLGSSRAVIAVGSWNPNVPCVPSLTALSSILGSAYPSESLAGSQWQTSSTAGGIPNKRALSPPCTLTNINGRSIPSYVEVDNVYLTSDYRYEDCSANYDPVNGGGSYGGSTFCDSTGNVFSIGTSSGHLHIEFDQDWMAKGYCGPASTVCNNSTIVQDISDGAISLDIQGFVYWDPEAPNAHWETHPITGWRLHQSNPSLTASFVSSPSSPEAGQQVTFTASASGGTAPYAFSWSFGDGSTGIGSSTTHSYSSPGTFTVVLTVRDSGSPQQTANSQQPISVTGPQPLSASFNFSPSSPTAGQTVTFTASVSGGTSPYTFLWGFGDGGSATGSPTTHVYSSAGSYAVTLTASDSANHTAVVSNGVTVSTFDFKLAANPYLLTVLPGQNTQSQIAVTSLGGFKGTVTLTASVPSQGLTVSMQNPSVTLSAGQTVNDNLKVAASKTAPTGVYVVTVTGTSGQLVHSLNVTVRVPDFNMSANPATLDVPAGSTGTAQILFQSINGFQGGLSTSISVTPAGPKATLTPNNPSLTANGTTSSVLTIQVPSNLAAGVYNVTIKATSGSLVHLLVVQVLVGLHPAAPVVSCSPSSVIVNQASTCTATVSDTSTVSPITPTGTVTFAETGLVGSFSSTSCSLSSGSCSVTFTPTAIGNASVTGVYGGDSSHGGSTSAATSVTVNPRTTSTVLNCSGPVVVNQASSCTATVSDTSPGTAITPTGSVNFTETGAAGSFSSATCTLVSGRCSVTFTAIATGTATITGAYNGDTTHDASISASASLIISPRTTSTAISCTSPVVVNQASNCTVTITDSSGGNVVTPAGSVSFVSDSPGTFSATSCAIAAVSMGVAGCSVSYTPGATGNHLITASYTGDSIHLGGSSFPTITVGSPSTGTTVSCAPNGLGVDEACTATVTDNLPGTVVKPVGSVSFTTNSTGAFSSNTCNLSGTGTSGVASCEVTYTPVGVATHTITGSYSGDTIHLASQGSASIGFGKYSTTTTVACSPSSVAINQVTTCTVSVSDTTTIGPTTPTGTVSFASNGAGAFAGSPCTLVSQTATSSSCQVTYTPTSGAGTHSIAATYNGDATHNGSTQAFSLTVTLRTTSTSVSCSPSSVVVNQATSCTAVVVDSSGSGGITPTGNVAFTPGGSCTLVSGSCSVSIIPSSSGSLSVLASYGGDSSHSTSSGSTTVLVGKRGTSTMVSCSPSPVTNNTVASCVATVTDTDVGAAITPSGSVGFASNSTGVFSQPSCALAATGTAGVASCSVNYTPGVTGFHAITASYAGDSSHLGRSGSMTLTVVGAAPKPAYALIVSADGKVSRLYQNGTLALIGQPVTTPLRSVAWKPDGSYALISGDFAVLLKYDGTTLTTIPIGISTGFNFWSVSWKPDGSYALVGGTSGILFKYDGVKVTIISNASTTILSINWQPSGSYALLVGKSGLALTYDGTIVRSFATGTTFDLDAAAWNPNGVYALIGGLNRTLLQFDGTTVAAINTSIVPPNNAIRAISFNQAGTMALLAGDNGMVLTWNGSTLTMLPTLTSSYLYSIGWSPSGMAYIVGGSGIVLTYTNGILAKLATSPVTTTQYRGIAWKPQ